MNLDKLKATIKQVTTKEEARKIISELCTAIKDYRTDLVEAKALSDIKWYLQRELPNLK